MNGYLHAWMDNISYLYPLNALFIFIIIIITRHVIAFKTTEVKDYCQGESFRTNCSDDEVVIMTMALYGRMRIDRCVKQEFKLNGCQADVINLADIKCSGRRKCELSIPDMTFESTKPCGEMQSYLEAAYVCHKVAILDKNNCMNRRSQILTDPRGSIASVTVNEMRCGTRDIPWIIQGLKGQQINLKLVDFNAPQRNVTQLLQRTTIVYLEETCHKYAAIEEKGDEEHEDRTVLVCGRKQRIQELYTSRGHVVHISVEPRSGNPDHFLINYEIIGCADPILSEHSWFKKDTPIKGTIWCKPTDEKWDITCHRGVWKGAYSNCTDVLFGESVGRASTDDQSAMSRTILITVSVLLLLLIIFIIIIVIFFYRRYHYHHHPHHHHHHHQCEYPTPISMKSKSSWYGASKDDLDRHHHHHHQHQSSYSTRSLRYGHHHDHHQHHHHQQQQYEKNRRSDSPCSRSAYSDYIANYEKMDDDVEESSPPLPPLPLKMKTSAKTSAVNLNTSTGEKVTHIWEMPLPIPGEL